eukprot:6183351-Pleurochrysis_carterae.AAC.4
MFTSFGRSRQAMLAGISSSMWGQCIKIAGAAAFELKLRLLLDAKLLYSLNSHFCPGARTTWSSIMHTGAG